MEGYTEASGCLSLVNSSEWWHPPPITAFETWRLVAACRALTSQASAVLSGTRESVREESHQAHIFAAASGGMTLHCSQNCTIIEKTHSTKQKLLPSANPLHWILHSKLAQPKPPSCLDIILSDIIWHNVISLKGPNTRVLNIFLKCWLLVAFLVLHCH